MAGGRRRTDAAEPPVPPAPGEVSDHPTAPGRSRVDRRGDGVRDSTDTGRRGGLGRRVDAPGGSRSRPPVPPPLRPVPTGPRTTMAPFQAAVPGAGAPEAPGGRDDLWASPGRGQRGADRRAADRRERDRLEAERQEAARREAEQRAAQQREAERREALRREAERREAERLENERRAEQRRSAQQREAERRAAEARVAQARAPRGRAGAPSEAWSTGPAGRRPGPPGAPGPAGAAPAARGPAYGEPDEDYSSQRFARLRAGAPTEITETAEPEVAPRRRDRDDDYYPDDHDDEPAPPRRGPVAGPGPVTDPGSVTATIGGRAALREQRRAAEAARKKKAPRGTRGSDRPAGSGRRSPRRAVLGLVAVAVVALGVLGVYSYASPHTQQAAAQRAATQTGGNGNALGTVPGVSDLPPLSTAPAPTSAAPATPVRVPVTVLNSTDITGLAASIAGKIKAGGWPTLQVGAYENKDVAATTVYFTQGDEKQRQAALQLIQQFPQLHGPAARFFNVPASAAGGLVVVATGDWKP